MPDGFCGGADEIRFQAEHGFIGVDWSEERKKRNWQRFIEKRREYLKNCDYPDQLTDALENVEPPYQKR